MTMLAPQPRYRQLAQTLINEIESGRYPVGDLPRRSSNFGASRFTVRKALKQLVQLDLWSFKNSGPGKDDRGELGTEARN